MIKIEVVVAGEDVAEISELMQSLGHGGTPPSPVWPAGVMFVSTTAVSRPDYFA